MSMLRKVLQQQEKSNAAEWARGCGFVREI